jgi:hypothetical protein
VVIIAISAFFLVGVMVGIAVVSAGKADRKHRRGRTEAAGDINRRGKSSLPV